MPKCELDLFRRKLMISKHLMNASCSPDHGHIKILRRYKDQELSRKFWIAHSFNSNEYDDFDIEIAQVRSLWIVKQHIVSDVLL